jgi:hypothetical protein
MLTGTVNQEKIQSKGVKEISWQEKASYSGCQISW